MIAVSLLCLVFGSDATRALRVSPELHPASDKKFFGKDYPDDLRPGGKDHFNYPFPIVQEDKDYDKDYVKDENRDNGEWKAQSTYDHLRMKLSNLKAQAARADATEGDKHKAFQEAEQKLQDAQDKAKAAESAANDAEKKVEEAQEHLDEHKKHATNATGNGTNAGGDGSGGDAEGGANGTDAEAEAEAAGNASVGNASNEVNKEEMDLEECMKQLEEAKEKLKKLMEEKAKAEAEHKAALEELANATALEANETQHAADLATKRREAEENHADSIKTYDEEKAKLEQMQKDLEAKAKKLRSFREAAMGKASNDGLYEDKKKSGVHRASLLASFAILVAALSA